MKNIQTYFFTGIFVAIVFISLLPGVSVSQANDSDKVSRVLILLSYHDTHSWTSGILDGVKAELATASLDLELHVEFMDTKRNNPADIFPHLEELYRTKYKKTKFDLIIIADNNALNFLLPRRTLLFPGVPVVFCGINNFSPSLIKGFDKITGVEETSDFSGSIELALKLQPGTRYVAVVCDHTPSGIAHIKDIQKIIPAFAGRIGFIELFNRTEKEIKTALQNLPDRSIVFMLSFYNDRNGKHFTIPEQAKLITEASGVPVYTVWDISLGFGVVGGVMTNGRSQGKNAAQLAIRILKGEAAEQIAVVSKSPNVAMLDYQVARHFSLPLEKLSDKTVFINKPESFYNDHRSIIWTTILVFLVQLLIISFLIFNIRRRKLAEKRLNKQSEGLKDIVEERTAELSLSNKELNLEINIRKKAEEASRKSEEQWDRTFNSFTDLVTIQDTDLRIIKANKAASTTLDLPLGDIINQHCYDLFGDAKVPCQNCPLLKTRKSFIPYTREIYHEKLQKTFLVSAAPVFDKQGELEYIAHVAKDITTIKRLESQLVQSHKMEAIGTMAGGIAHDFNNILTAIIGYAEFIQEEAPKESKIGRDIAEVLMAGNRATELVKQIITFSHQATTEKHIVQPHLIIREALKMLRATLPTTVAIEEDIDPESGHILADPTIIHQIIVNLCTNALFALDEQKGTLQVSLRCMELTAEELDKRENVAPGSFSLLTVKDSGCGMDQSTIDRIFEPYFTTREVGRGSGLGLAIVHGAVEKYNGFIEVESSVGKGTVFSVYLPLVEEATTETVVAGQQGREKALPGNGRILVVDDELLLVRINKKRLESFGYQVKALTDSSEALKIFTDQPDNFDLLITDQTMPKLTGAELARAALNIKPSLPIIMCTGHSDVFSEEEALALGIKKYLFKPLHGAELLDAVHEVLTEK